MDYIFAASMSLIKGLLHCLVAYDIACQWSIRLQKRLENVPHFVRFSKENIETLDHAIPQWHGGAHCLKCQEENRIDTRVGVGKVDGEGCERLWSLHNPAAFSTKEMSEEGRHDALDDRFDYSNSQKNFHQGKLSFEQLMLC